MKKRQSILVLILMMITLTACGGANGAETPDQPAAAIEKDVTMLLKGIGDSKAMVESLGDLPEAQVNGNLYYYQNASTEGYFAGFDLGLETEADGDTVKQIYIQPIGDAKITANGLRIGGTIADAKAAFGDGELSSMEQNGKIVNFMLFSDGAYAMKATVADQSIIAVAFTIADPEVAEKEPAQAEEQETAQESGAAEESTDETEVSSNGAYELDYLLEFVGHDFAEVEKVLGSNYSRFEEEYEDVVVYESGDLNVSFSVGYDTDKVSMVTVMYDSIDSSLEQPIGMGGVLLGSVTQEEEHEFAYGKSLIYVMIDCNDVVYGLQAMNGYADETADSTQAPAGEETIVDRVDFGAGGYELVLEDFDTYSILSVRDTDTGEKAVLVNTDGRWDGDQFFDGFDVKILKAKASKDGSVVYFETDDPKMTNGYGASNNTILKYDIANGYEENFSSGYLYDTVKVAGYDDCIIINYYEPSPRGGYYEPYILIDGEGKYHFMGTELESDLADQIRRAYNDEIDEYAMETPVAENIYGKYIDFSKYSAVVVENYQGINKDKFIRERTLQNPYYKDDGQPLYPDVFAVFGTVYNVRWEVGISMGESKVYPVADQMSDTYVTFETRRPGDMSVDTFTFEDKHGKKYRIVIEDMSDNIDVVPVP